MILGADIGQARDPAALAVLEGFDVRHLERLPLGTPYPDLARRIALVAAVGSMGVIVDATGIGRAVVDLLEERGLLPIAVTLTGGHRLHVAGRAVSLPRSALFGPLVAAVEAGRLRVAPGLPGGAALLQKLQAARGGVTIETRGLGHHGDLMVAVALALWGQGVQRHRIDG